MNQLQKILARLSSGQKLTIALSAVMAAAGLMAFARWRHESDFRPLYTALAPEDAGAVLQKLKETGTDFRLSDNGTTLLVPSQKLAELRLQMALSGVPKSGRLGFEIFDKTSFGVTDFAEHVNYRRALEGELERSITSLAGVEKARVHLTFSKDSVYLESRQPAKASVILGLHSGVQLSPQNVLAICNLLASAVEGLAPEAVSVVDTWGHLLNRARKAGSLELGGSEADLEYREQIEKGLLAKIQSTLEPLLGAERFRASVSAECDFSSGEQSEETFDPSRSVMVSSQKSEDVAPSMVAGGMPGTASNLPRPPARTSAAGTGASRRTEEISYQSSRVLKRMKLPQGEIKRISVSLLLDQDVRWEGKPPQVKQVMVPPSPEKLKAIRDLVSGAISFKAERGDQLIVETLPFEATLRSEPPVPDAPRPPRAAPVPLSQQFRNPKVIGGVAGGLAAMAVLLVVVMRRKRKPAATNVGTQAELQAGGQSPAALGPAESGAGNIEAQIADRSQMQDRLEAEALSAIKVPSSTSNKKEALSKYLRESLKKDPAGQAQILRTWLHEKS
ncbi:MAG: flagellar basal-body MS-ring/collar protein FliF [Bryobacteraceae bacterium]